MHSLSYLPLYLVQSNEIMSQNKKLVDDSVLQVHNLQSNDDILKIYVYNDG